MVQVYYRNQGCIESSSMITPLHVIDFNRSSLLSSSDLTSVTVSTSHMSYIYVNIINRLHPSRLRFKPVKSLRTFNFTFA